MGIRFYIRCRWKHDSEDLPVEIWSEFDEERFESRKLEYFRDGTVGYADRLECSPRTQLADQPLPQLDEIFPDDEFEELEVSDSTFEERWIDRMKQRSGP